MILFDTFFKPRKLPAWWTRFIDAYPLVPNIFAVAALTWICFSLASIFSASEMHGNGKFVETVGVVSGSEPLVEKAISLRATYHRLFPSEVRTIVNNLYCNIPLYMVVPLLLLLEFLFPCNPRQPLIGKGFLQDAVWYTLFTPMTILIIFPIVEFLHGLFTQHLGFLTFATAKNWPAFIQIIAAFLLAEFFTWFNHFVRHKVRTLWYFHAVHHSQRELNIFTDDRAHMVDLLVGNLLTFIPFFIFDVSNLYAVMVIGLYKPIHNRFIHANLKINLGWLGWMVTSPQFHRVHHSSDPAHADKNFGVYFSIYDHLFGTACTARNIYPETGIEDPQFPLEEKVRVRQLPENWFSQTMYPFRQVYDQVHAAYRLNMARVRIAFRRNDPNTGES